MLSANPLASPELSHGGPNALVCKRPCPISMNSPRATPRPTIGSLAVEFIPVELSIQRRGDLRQTVESPLRRPLGNACFAVDCAPGVPLGAQGRYSRAVH